MRKVWLVAALLCFAVLSVNALQKSEPTAHEDLPVNAKRQQIRKPQELQPKIDKAKDSTSRNSQKNALETDNDDLESGSSLLDDIPRDILPAIDVLSGIGPMLVESESDVKTSTEASHTTVPHTTSSDKPQQQQHHHVVAGSLSAADAALDKPMKEVATTTTKTTTTNTTKNTKKNSPLKNFARKLIKKMYSASAAKSPSPAVPKAKTTTTTDQEEKDRIAKISKMIAAIKARRKSRREWRRKRKGLKRDWRAQNLLLKGYYKRLMDKQRRLAKEKRKLLRLRWQRLRRQKLARIRARLRRARLRRKRRRMLARQRKLFRQKERRFKREARWKKIRRRNRKRLYKRLRQRRRQKKVLDRYNNKVVKLLSDLQGKQYTYLKAKTTANKIADSVSSSVSLSYEQKTRLKRCIKAGKKNVREVARYRLRCGRLPKTSIRRSQCNKQLKQFKQIASTRIAIMCRKVDQKTMDAACRVLNDAYNSSVGQAFKGCRGLSGHAQAACFAKAGKLKAGYSSIRFKCAKLKEKLLGKLTKLTAVQIANKVTSLFATAAQRDKYANKEKRRQKRRVRAVYRKKLSKYRAAQWRKYREWRRTRRLRIKHKRSLRARLRARRRMEKLRRRYKKTTNRLKKKTQGLRKQYMVRRFFKDISSRHQRRLKRKYRAYKRKNADKKKKGDEARRMEAKERSREQQEAHHQTKKH